MRHRAHTFVCGLVLALAAAGGASAAEPAERAATYDDALARAKASGKDIVVFERGSDWNRLGERLLADVWMKDEFAAAVGNGAILVVVDKPEAVGGTPVSRNLADCATGERGGTSALQRLRKLADAAQPLPACEITAVAGAAGVTYKRLPDGAFLAEGANPAHDTLTLKLKTERGGKVLRLDFPPHDSLPGRGPGRASNGNFAVSEIEVLEKDQAVKLDAVWANASEGAWGPWRAIDGISDKTDSIWNPAAHHHQQRTLLLVLSRPMAAGAELSVRVICRSQWGQHVPGCMRAAVLPEANLEADVSAVGKAELENARNAKFNWRGANVPRIALMDSLGRPVASEDKPRLGLTPVTLAARVRELQDVRAKRDALWAQAEKEQGPQKAETLMRSLDLLKLGGSPGHQNVYKFVHDQMRAADPKDESGCVRWLQFQPDPRCMPALVNPAYKLAGEKKYEEAIALLDGELKHPGNRRLTRDHIQRIMMGKFHVYRQWKEHEEQRFDVLREIAALDPSTYLGIGATGYLAMHYRTPAPVALVYGWNGKQVKAGVNAWDLALDTGIYFDHAGAYCLRIRHNGGRDTVKVRRVAIMDGATVLAEASPQADLAPGGKVEMTLDLAKWRADRTYTVHLEVEAAEGKTDAAGRFEVDPLL
jgi:hypothetical protein